MQIVKSDSDRLSTTSKIIADVFGKVHRNICRDISALECSDEFRALNFEQSHYTSPQNKKIKCYNITEEGFYFLAMGFTGKKAAKWKEEFIAEFKRLRTGMLNIDERMTSISNRLDNVKEAGKLWSELGREINKDKKLALLESKKLLEDVQLKLDY